LPAPPCLPADAPGTILLSLRAALRRNAFCSYLFLSCAAPHTAISCAHTVWEELKAMPALNTLLKVTSSDPW
jgi:hypothetical protein